MLLALLLAACQADTPERPAAPKAVEVAVAPLEAIRPESRALGPINELSYNEVYMAYGESPAGGLIPDPTYTKVLKGLITYGITVFQPLLFYPDRNGVYNNIYLKGFYPREGVLDFDADDAVRDINNMIHYRINGGHDIMISSGVRGSYANTLQEQYEGDPETSEGARLRYQHLLSRLSFTAQRTSTWPATLQLTGIWISKVSDSAVLDLTKAYTDPDVLVFQSPHDKEFTVYENSAGLELTTSASAVLGEAMIEPDAEFEVKVRISSGEVLTVAEIKSSAGNTINIIGDDTPTATVHDIVQRGYHYNIALRFENLNVKATVKTAAWNDYIAGDDTGWW